LPFAFAFAVAVAFAFAFAFLVVIPQRSEGICCCTCSCLFFLSPFSCSSLLAVLKPPLHLPLLVPPLTSIPHRSNLSRTLLSALRKPTNSKES
jgi:hypothetical protein